MAGGLTAEAALEVGLDSGTPVVVGGGDGACAALGAGLVTPGAVADATIGSSAWLSIATDAPVRDPLQRTVTFDHVVPGRYLPLVAMQSAGASLDCGDGFEALLAAAAHAKAASDAWRASWPTLGACPSGDGRSSTRPTRWVRRWSVESLWASSTTGRRPVPARASTRSSSPTMSGTGGRWRGMPAS